MNSRRNIVKSIVIVAVGAAVILLPLYGGYYYTGTLILSGIYAILIMGWILLIRVGQFSLGQAGFLAIGGYTAAVLTTKFGWNPWFAVPMSGVVAALFAAGIGAVVLRLTGAYFFMVSIAFAEIVRLVALNMDFLGKSDGISGIPYFPPILGVDFSSRTNSFFVLVFLVLISALVFWQISRSRIGRMFAAVARSEHLAQSLGINLMKYRVIAFVVAAFFAGVAGSFYAHFYTAVSPDVFVVWKSVLVQIGGTIGGMGSIVLGPLVGSIVLNFGSELLRSYARGFDYVILGAVVMAILIFAPGGLVGLGDLLKRWAKYWESRRTRG